MLTYRIKFYFEIVNSTLNKGNQIKTKGLITDSTIKTDGSGQPGTLWNITTNQQNSHII